MMLIEISERMKLTSIRLDDTAAILDSDSACGISKCVIGNFMLIPDCRW